MTRERRTIGLVGRGEEIDVDLPPGEPAPLAEAADLRVIGRNSPRLDGAPKVTGRAIYTHDVRRPGMLYARIVRSPLPAARVVSVDVAPAARLPGVRATLALGVGEVRFEGEEVAAVAAQTPEQAEDAARAVQVIYEERPFVIDVERAHGRADLVAPGTPQDPAVPRVYRDRSNAGRTSRERRGQAGAALAQCDTVVEATFRTQVQTHCCLETHGVVAEWAGDNLTVWASTQGTFSVREGLAQALGIPESRVRVVCEHMGGGFGSKFGAGAHGVIAARLAREANAPVHLMLDRRSEHLATGNRPNSVQRLTLGAKDGRLHAARLIAYGSAGVGTGAGVGGPLENLYAIPHLEIEETDVFTHAGAGSPFRAPGFPQGAFALEQAVDMLAERLAIDPLAFRQRTDPSAVRQEEYRLGAERIGWSRRRPTPARFDPAGPAVRRGLGVASACWFNTGGPGAVVSISLEADGTAVVANGAQDIGTGTRTWMAVVAAEELGLPIEQVRVRLGDTGDPYGPASGGSTTTPSLAPAVRAAAHQARLRLLEAAAALLAQPAADLAVRDGKVHARDGRAVPFGRIVGQVPGGRLTVTGERARDWQGLGAIAGAQFAEVLVDVETGVIRVERVVAVHDCGRVINPLTAESQVHGGVIQGMSYALFEERILDRNTGQMVNANLDSYKIAGSEDIPEIISMFVDVRAGHNNLDALGLGEPATVPTSAALANAVANATGVRLFELPMNPMRVLRAFEAARA